MLALLDRHAFRGERPTGAPLTFAGRAAFSGVIACVAWPREWLAKRLPDALELAPATGHDGGHPVVIVFGEQRAPALLRMGVAVPMGAPYGELGVLVPYVRGVGRTRLATYVWRMCSTYFPAVWEGNTRYFAKALATMTWHGSHLVVTDEARRPVLQALVDPDGEWRRGATSDLPVVRAIADAVALPVVGVPASGRVTCSQFGWDLDGAHVRPARVAVSVAGSLVADDVPHELAAAADSAIAVRDMAWRLGWPAAWQG